MRHRRDDSAGVVVFHREPDGCRFLLLLSRLTKRPLWEFAKGGIDPGETPLQAALRELAEETNLGPDDIRLVPGFQESERYRFLVDRKCGRTLVHKRVTYFLAEALHRRVRVSAAEIERYAWLELVEALRRLRYRQRRRILTAAAAAADCPGSESVGNDLA